MGKMVVKGEKNADSLLFIGWPADRRGGILAIAAGKMVPGFT
ncbi:MAG: hypothetical protein SPF51_08735 [Candidatus Fimivicinus sp.]|nr:hypothetical protein [Candidatus Fimivicinus sp.]